jgi:hypothetical protein
MVEMMRITDATLDIAAKAAWERFWGGYSKRWEDERDPVYRQFWREIAKASIEAYFDAASLHR